MGRTSFYALSDHPPNPIGLVLSIRKNRVDDVMYPLETARKLDEMFEEDEEDDPVSAEATVTRSNAIGTEPSTAPAASARLPDLKRAVEAGGPMGVNTSQAKARLLAMSQVLTHRVGGAPKDVPVVICARPAAP